MAIRQKAKREARRAGLNLHRVRTEGQALNTVEAILDAANTARRLSIARWNEVIGLRFTAEHATTDEGRNRGERDAQRAQTEAVEMHLNAIRLERDALTLSESSLLDVVLSVAERLNREDAKDPGAAYRRDHTRMLRTYGAVMEAHFATYAALRVVDGNVGTQEGSSTDPLSND